MGEEVKITEYEANGGGGDGGDEARVLEWEMGLPSDDDLTPLTQMLIPPELASAFSISPEPRRSTLDVNRASRSTLSSLRSGGAHSSNNNNNSNHRSLGDPMVVEPDGDGDGEGDGDGSGAGSDPRKLRKVDCTEEADSAARSENPGDPTARTLKRPRLVWTPQLHKRFVDVVAHLGIKNAVPKTIMQLMNVEGLTRENVASHLQKYRLYLKRMQGLSSEGPSSSDHLFASTPTPQSLHENGGGASANGGHMGMPIPVPYGAPMMPMPMPVYGHMGMNQGGYHHQQNQQNGFEGNPYGMMQQRDWSGNKYGSMVSYPHHVAPNGNDK